MKVLVVASGQEFGQGAGYFCSEACVRGFEALGLETRFLDESHLGDLELVAKEFGPDFVFHRMAQRTIGEMEAFIALNECGIPVVLWEKTEEEDFHVTSGFSSQVALYCTSSGRHVQMHRDRGANAIWLPSAADHTRFFKMAPVRGYEFDLVYIGYPFGHKLEMLGALKSHFSCHFDHSIKVPFTEQNKYYNSSRVMIDPGQHQDLVMPEGKLAACPTRTFEVPASGGFQLMKQRKDLPLLYSSEEVATYNSTPEDAISKIKYYLENDQERSLIAQKAYHRTIKDHFVVHRLRTVMEELCKLKNSTHH